MHRLPTILLSAIINSFIFSVIYLIAGVVIRLMTDPSNAGMNFPGVFLLLTVIPVIGVLSGATTYQLFKKIRLMKSNNINVKGRDFVYSIVLSIFIIWIATLLIEMKL